jgi:hypothetical protein
VSFTGCAILPKKKFQDDPDDEREALLRTNDCGDGRFVRAHGFEDFVQRFLRRDVLFLFQDRARDRFDVRERAGFRPFGCSRLLRPNELNIRAIVVVRFWYMVSDWFIQDAPFGAFCTVATFVG